MKSIYKIFAIASVFTFSSCIKGVDEVVQSAYLEPIIPEPVYKFSRIGESSVDLVECEFLDAPLERIYKVYLKPARISDDLDNEEVQKLYKEGEFGLKPIEEIAKSELHSANRAQIVTDITDLINTTSAISGYGQTDPFNHRRREAKVGAEGYVGNNIGDPNIYFVNNKGLVVAEMFHYSVLGAIYLDKILNVHLDDEVLNNPEIRRKHENVDLIVGRNYTELEHHWDLAYGYFKFWRKLAHSEGLPALKNSELFINRALVKGRTYMEDFRYDDMKMQLDTIRTELSRVVAIRAMNLLVGDNTLVNIDENPKYAFLFVSKACGLIYASQFARNKEGKQIITYAEVEEMLDNLFQGNGLWDKERLLADENTVGSLKHTALSIGNKFGISLREISK